MSDPRNYDCEAWHQRKNINGFALLLMDGKPAYKLHESNEFWSQFGYKSCGWRDPLRPSPVVRLCGLLSLSLTPVSFKGMLEAGRIRSNLSGVRQLKETKKENER